MVSEEDCKATSGMEPSTSILKNVHASSMVGMKVAGKFLLNHVTAEGQIHANNDLGRGHESLVMGRHSSNQQSERNWGAFHLLPHELQQSMICFGKQQASIERKWFDNASKAQKEVRSKKEEIALQKKT